MGHKYSIRIPMEILLTIRILRQNTDTSAYNFNARVLLARLALRNARSAALEALIWAVEKEQIGSLVRQRSDGVFTYVLLKRYDDETEEQREKYKKLWCDEPGQNNSYTRWILKGKEYKYLDEQLTHG